MVRFLRTNATTLLCRLRGNQERQSFNSATFNFWVVAKEAALPALRALDMAVQTISAQCATGKSPGREPAAHRGPQPGCDRRRRGRAHEADHIFRWALLPVAVLEPPRADAALNLGISDGIAKLAVHAAHPVLDEPHLRLLCHEGEFQPLLGELALHKLDAVLADRAAPPNPALKTPSQLLGTSAVAWYAPPVWAEAAARQFPQSLAVVPVLLPTDHAAMRARIDHWLERERIRPRIAGEFEDSALLSTFAATGMGVMPAPVSLGEHLAQTHGLVQVGTTPDVQEQFHLIYSARKVMHPLLTRLLEAGKGGMLLN